MGDIRRYMPQLVTGLPGQRSPVGVAMVEVSDGGCGFVDLPEHERALAAEARWSALEAVARAERDAAVSVSAELREQVSAREAMIARLHLDLSAKDAEIAELREAMAKQAAAVRNLHSAEKVIASGLLREADKLNKQSNPEAIASERDANAALTDALEAAERERDEARECVRRLWRAGSPFQEAVPYFDSRHDAQISTEWQALQSALAATPEHLR